MNTRNKALQTNWDTSETHFLDRSQHVRRHQHSHISNLCSSILYIIIEKKVQGLTILIIRRCVIHGDPAPLSLCKRLISSLSISYTEGKVEHLYPFSFSLFAAFYLSSIRANHIDSACPLSKSCPNQQKLPPQKYNKSRFFV
jgi:hypothetical protein